MEGRWVAKEDLDQRREERRVYRQNVNTVTPPPPPPPPAFPTCLVAC